MLGFIGIFLGIAAVVFLAWQRWSAAVCAIVGALIVGIFNGFGIWGTLTNYFLPAAGNWVGTFIIMFLTSSMYAKIIGDSGAATRIAHTILQLTSKKHIYTALILIVMALTYGGVNALIIIFVFWPIAMPIAKELNQPRHIFLSCLYFGFLTGACTSLPGTPQNANVFAAQALGTSGTAAPVLGILSAIIMFVFDALYIKYIVKKAEKEGRTFEDNVGMKMEDRDINTCPNILNSVVPVVILLATFMILSNGWFGLEKTSAVVAVTSGNVIASAVCIMLNKKYFKNIKESIIGGLNSGLGPASNMFTMIAFTAVVSATPAYAAFANWVMTIGGHPYFQAILASQLIGLITASAGATVQFTCNTFGSAWLAYPGINVDALTRIVSISAVGLSCGPHAGGLFTNLDVSGTKMKDVFLPQFIGGGVISIICALLCAVLALLGIA